MVSVDTFLSGLPFARANLSVFVTVLEPLDQSQDFIDVSAHWQVVELHVSHDAFAIYDECGSKKHAVIRCQASIVFPDLFR